MRKVLCTGRAKYGKDDFETVPETPRCATYVKETEKRQAMSPCVKSATDGIGRSCFKKENQKMKGTLSVSLKRRKRVPFCVSFKLTRYFRFSVRFLTAKQDEYEKRLSAGLPPRYADIRKNGTIFFNIPH